MSLDFNMNESLSPSHEQTAVRHSDVYTAAQAWVVRPGVLFQAFQGRRHSPFLVVRKRYGRKNTLEW